ncbi:MAG TPA: methyltransferase domain-containing protein, partial [Vicinamibacterales bacterium]
HGGFGLPRFMIAGLPAFALVVAALLLERQYGDCTRSSAVGLVSDSSYILYLIHPYVIFGLLRTLWPGHARMAGPAAAGLAICLLLAATAVAVVIHVSFERPIMNRLRGWLLSGRPVAAAVKDFARRWDLDLLLRTYLFIPRKMLRDAVREFGSQLDGRMLDVGCGTQQYRKFLKCRQYFGVDWTLVSRPPAVADITRIPFRDRAFDSALCTEVLEHLPEPGRCLDEIRRVVKPGGTVFFTVPMTMYTHSEPYDFYRYTEYGLRYLLEKHGFEILKLRRLGGVVSVMASHGISLGCDALADRLDQSVLRRIRHAVLLPFSVCSSVFFYGLSRLVDGFERQDAIGWAAMCRTKN